ncbi:MAG: glycosyltransferase family 2 protein [Deltaproteobacteria bacterium]|nr:glycosyltransferase family 2 protein [Deltaproteobacteria bacterium]
MPRVSVVIRSYNRLVALCELIEAVLAQDHDSFEIVVVEQSTNRPAEAAAWLGQLEADPRLRVLRSGPLGGARARNRGVAASRGEVIVCIDDDDLPVGDQFLREVEAPFRADPKLLGLTCRHYWGEQEEITPFYRRLAANGRVMKFSRGLRLPLTYPRFDQRVAPVDYVHGSGGAYRREVFTRFGGWDEDTPIEDETSLGIRIGRGLKDGEYLAFEPGPRLRRRLDVDGGLAKRSLTPAKFYARFMGFVHAILGRYYPDRVRWAYPAYVLAGLWWTWSWIWVDSQAHQRFHQKISAAAAMLITLPYHAILAWRVPFGETPGSGERLLIEHELRNRMTTYSDYGDTHRTAA